MLIITIQFSGCNKKYDYVLDNPDNYNIDISKNIKIIRGISKNTPYYSYAHVVKIESADTIPAHVHTKLLAGKNNQMVPSGIGTINAKKTQTPVTPPKHTPRIQTRDYKKLERLYQELKWINKQLQDTDLHCEQLKAKLVDYELEELFRTRGIYGTVCRSGIKTPEDKQKIQDDIKNLVLEKQSLMEQKQQQLDRIDSFWR